MTAYRPIGPVVGYEDARSLWRYDHQTGDLTWLVAPCRNRHVGDVAGSLGRFGYVFVTWRGRRYTAQRLAWLLMTGSWPSGEVDHIDRCRSNNRWDNLRNATKAQNQANSGGRINNTSGYRGISQTKTGRWRARINHQGSEIHLGVFDTPEAAKVVWLAKAKELWGNFACTF